MNKSKRKTRVVILGAEGMIGHKLFEQLSKYPSLDVFATSHSGRGLSNLPKKLKEKIVVKVDANDLARVKQVLWKLKPDVVINCIGITKQKIDESNPLPVIELNSAFPHKLAALCAELNARMIQMATDCVFSGKKGNYKETDIPDATDLYGRTKFLGEVNYPHCLTLRTSFIGHELSESPHGLLEWFLCQKRQAKGFSKAFYSGLTTLFLAEVLYKYILPRPKLHGLYQLSSSKISKYELLQIIAKVYGKKINIVADGAVNIDRSLNSGKLRKKVGFKPKSWQKMIEEMYLDFQESEIYAKK